MMRRSRRVPLAGRLLRIGVLVTLTILILIAVAMAFRARGHSQIVSQFRAHGLIVSYNAIAARSDVPFTDLREIGASRDDRSGLWASPTAVLVPLAPNPVREHTADADLEGLEELRTLQVLDLGYCRISDVTMRRIGRLTHLKYLNLDGTGITDAGLTELKKLKELTQLHLAFTEVSDSGLVTVGQLPCVGVLDLTDTKITDAGLGHLHRMKSLRVLLLDYCQVTADGMAQLRSLNLVRLGLNGVSLNDEGVERLGELKSLRFLSVLQTDIANQGGETRLRQLLPNLQTLDVGGSTFSAGGGAMPSEYEGVDWGALNPAKR